MDEWKLKWWEGLVLLWVGAVVLGVLLQFTIGWGVIGSWLGGPDASGWVQAVGSLIGLAVAIAVPWRVQWTERKRRMEEDRARAKVVAVGVAVDLEAMLEMASRTAKQIEDQVLHGKAVALGLISKGFESLILPSDDHVLQIQVVEPVAAVALRRGVTRFRQLRSTIKLFAEEPDGPKVHAALKRLHRHFDPAITDMLEALARLEALSGKIPEFPVPPLESPTP